MKGSKEPDLSNLIVDVDNNTKIYSTSKFNKSVNDNRIYEDLDQMDEDLVNFFQDFEHRDDLIDLEDKKDKLFSEVSNLKNEIQPLEEHLNDILKVQEASMRTGDNSFAYPYINAPSPLTDRIIELKEILNIAERENMQAFNDYSHNVTKKLKIEIEEYNKIIEDLNFKIHYVMSKIKPINEKLNSPKVLELTIKSNSQQETIEHLKKQLNSLCEEENRLNKEYNDLLNSFASHDDEDAELSRLSRILSYLHCQKHIKKQEFNIMRHKYLANIQYISALLEKKKIEKAQNLENEHIRRIRIRNNINEKKARRELRTEKFIEERQRSNESKRQKTPSTYIRFDVDRDSPIIVDNEDDNKEYIDISALYSLENDDINDLLFDTKNIIPLSKTLKFKSCKAHVKKGGSVKYSDQNTGGFDTYKNKNRKYTNRVFVGNIRSSYNNVKDSSLIRKRKGVILPDNEDEVSPRTAKNKEFAQMHRVQNESTISSDDGTGNTSERNVSSDSMSAVREECLTQSKYASIIIDSVIKNIINKLSNNDKCQDYTNSILTSSKNTDELNSMEDCIISDKSTATTSETASFVSLAEISNDDSIIYPANNMLFTFSDSISYNEINEFNESLQKNETVMVSDGNSSDPTIIGKTENKNMKDKRESQYNTKDVDIGIKSGNPDVADESNEMITLFAKMKGDKIKRVINEEGTLKYENISKAKQNMIRNSKRSNKGHKNSYIGDINDVYDDTDNQISIDRLRETVHDKKYATTILTDTKIDEKEINQSEIIKENLNYIDNLSDNNLLTSNRNIMSDIPCDNHNEVFIDGENYSSIVKTEQRSKKTFLSKRMSTSLEKDDNHSDQDFLMPKHELSDQPSQYPRGYVNNSNEDSIVLFKSGNKSLDSINESDKVIYLETITLKEKLEHTKKVEQIDNERNQKVFMSEKKLLHTQNKKKNDKSNDDNLNRVFHQETNSRKIASDVTSHSSNKSSEKPYDKFVNTKNDINLSIYDNIDEDFESATDDITKNMNIECNYETNNGSNNNFSESIEGEFVKPILNDSMDTNGTKSIKNVKISNVIDEYLPNKTTYSVLTDIFDVTVMHKSLGEYEKESECQEENNGHESKNAKEQEMTYNDDCINGKLPYDDSPLNNVYESQLSHMEDSFHENDKANSNKFAPKPPVLQRSDVSPRINSSISQENRKTNEKIKFQKNQNVLSSFSELNQDSS